MDEIIKARIAIGSSEDLAVDRGDLLSNLVAASTREDKSSNSYLSNTELKG